MEVDIPDKKLKRFIEDDAMRRKRFGADMSRKIVIRMAALVAAQSLDDFWPPNQLPERCHELKGELSGVFSIDLIHPFRLLFRPVELENSSIDKPLVFDNRERWKNINRVEIVDIKDTHG
jgi:plasmid maintenance system killer protein